MSQITPLTTLWYYSKSLYGNLYYDIAFVYMFLLYGPYQLSSIPGLEDVRIEGVGQRQVVDPNCPVMLSSQSETPAVASPPEVQ